MARLRAKVKIPTLVAQNATKGGILGSFFGTRSAFDFLATGYSRLATYLPTLATFTPCELAA
jgi:hypothetical protein